MRVLCLGTTGYHPSPSRHTACYYLPDQRLLLDAGTGMLELTSQILAEPCESIDLLISHAHLDHVVGLTFILDTFAVTPLDSVRVWGTRAKLDAIQQHLFSEHLFPILPPSITFHPLDDAQRPLTLEGGATVSWFPLEHPGGSIGFRIQCDGKTMGYVTDTVARPTSSYLSEIRDLDLLLHECYFTDEHQALAVKTGHSWLSAVAELVEQVRPRKTGLIHLNPLAEVLGSSMILTEKHRRLGMFIPVEGEKLEV